MDDDSEEYWTEYGRKLEEEFATLNETIPTETYVCTLQELIENKRK